MKLAAIDNGYWATKVYTKDRQFSFRSKIEKASDTLNSNNTMNFTFENIDFIVGEGATMSNIEYDKTSNELHKICTYTALAKLSNFIGTDFNVIVGYPLNIYSTHAETFSQFLKTDGYIESLLEGETKLFSINNCTPFPQCAGAVYAYPERYKNRVLGVIDLGGLTANGCIFDNLNIVRESMFTENLGSIILFNKVKKVLEQKFNMSIQDYEVPGIIKNGLKKDKDLSLKVVNEVLFNHVEDIRKAMRVNKWNVDNLDILLVGGTSITLRNQLEGLFPQAQLSDDPVNDNVKGFYNIGEMIYGA